MFRLIHQIITEVRLIREAEARHENLQNEIKSLKSQLAEAKEREKSASDYASKYVDALYRHVPDSQQRWAVIVDVNSKNA